MGRIIRRRGAGWSWAFLSRHLAGARRQRRRLLLKVAWAAAVVAGRLQHLHFVHRVAHHGRPWQLAQLLAIHPVHVGVAGEELEGGRAVGSSR